MARLQLPEHKLTETLGYSPSKQKISVATGQHKQNYIMDKIGHVKNKVLQLPTQYCSL